MHLLQCVTVGLPDFLPGAGDVYDGDVEVGYDGMRFDSAAEPDA